MSRDFSPPEFDDLGRDLPESDVRSVDRHSQDREPEEKSTAFPSARTLTGATVPKTADRRFISGTDAPCSTTGTAATS